MAKSRVKLFLSNMIIYGFGGVLKGIVPFLMLPIVTRLLPSTEYFGLNDLVTIMVKFGSAFAVLGMYDAMFRLFFDKSDESYQKEICSTTAVFTFITSGVVCAVLIFWREPIGRLVFGNERYSYLVIIAAFDVLFGANNNIISAPTRMQNKRKIFLVTNALAPILSYAMAIPMLLMGYYTVALPLSSTLSALLILLTFSIINRKWFRLPSFKSSHLKPLLKFALPCFPNFIAYWIFTSCDRLMITQMLGTGAEGIYAAGGNIGQVSQLIYTAFSGGWQYFAFSTMRDDDQVSMTGHVFEYLGVLSFAACAVMMACNRWLFGLLFPADYQSGALVMPYLFLSPLLLMLMQTAGSQFLVIKKTWPGLIILTIGAVVNIALNWVLIPVLGIEGAAIATLAGYLVSLVINTGVLLHMGLIIVPRRFYGAAGLFVLVFLCWRFWLAGQSALLFLAVIALAGIYLWLYRKDILTLLGRSDGEGAQTSTGKEA